MTTIVMNTLNGAVTQYDWTFKSLSGAHAADDAGLYTLAGADDKGVAIASELRSGKTGGSTVTRLGNVYLALSGAGTGTLIVMGVSAEWQYTIVSRPSGVSLAIPGQGIRESWLGFGYKNASGADFRLDRIDAELLVSKNRRN